jgi:hypothetical protein
LIAVLLFSFSSTDTYITIHTIAYFFAQHPSSSWVSSSPWPSL